MITEEGLPQPCEGCGCRWACICQAMAAAVIPDAPPRVPGLGDKIEVLIGLQWLPATVTVEPKHGPMAVDWWDSTSRYDITGITGIFNFRLEGTVLYVGAAARVVGDEGKWRWPLGQS